MGISLKPEFLKRYKDIATLVFKYGSSDVVKRSGLHDALSEEDITEIDSSSKEESVKAEEFVKDLESRGPIYIKLGQVLSSRGDLLPGEYVKALAKLQDNITAFSFADVEQIVQEELGVRISKAFQSFESTPIATASLGQVHHAVLRDGREVVVKVQRPNIRKQIADDLTALEDLADFMDSHTELGKQYRFTEILAEFRKTLTRELDYRLEAKNLIEIGNNLSEFEHIVIPQPIDDYTTSRVLTMEYIKGKKITKLGPLAKLELHGNTLADELFKAYLKQILIDGVFHADPHPGNVFITDDQRVALIDLGMVGRISESMQDKLLKLLLAVSEGHSDDAATIGLKIGERFSDDKTISESEYRHHVAELVGAHHGSTVSDMQIGRMMMDFNSLSASFGIKMPSELTMLSKTLLNLDEIGRTLDPAFDPNASIRKHAYDLLRKKMVKSVSPGNILSSAMEAKEFVQELPGRVNRILDLLAKNKLKVQVDAIEEETLIDGFQKVSNRITTGLILAALIVGAAMLMRIETSFKIFGYPGFAMICFLAAAIGGFWLLISIALHDKSVAKGKKV